MADQFITPNWHPLFIHFPIALLIVGVLIEILSFAWPRGGFRAAGRWMILLGALLAIPAATAGIYAFRDVVSSGPLEVDPHWYQVVQQSRWSLQQWDFMGDHIWYNSLATVLFALVVIFWLGGSNRWRRSARWFLLLAMVAGVALMIIGAWHGAELVYRFGTAVSTTTTPFAGEGARHNVEYFIPPLQLHMVLAGLVAAAVVAAVGVMIRRWQLDSMARIPLPYGRQPTVVAVALSEETPGAAERQELYAGQPHPEDAAEVASPSKVYPGWVWLGGFVLAICTVLAGAWAVLEVFTREGFQKNLEELQEPDHRRLLLHVIFGVSIVVLSLLLAGLVRFARFWRVLAGVLGGIVLLLIAGQVWLGTLMAYDGQGPLLGFTVAQAAVPGGHEPPAHQPDAAPKAMPAPPKQNILPQPAPVPAPGPAPSDRAPHEEVGGGATST